MTNELRVPTRMGDGTFTHLTRSEIRADLDAGVGDRGQARQGRRCCSDDEIAHLLEIYASPLRFIGVDVGEEVVLSCDGTGMKTHATRIQDLQSYEQWMGADLLELCVGDYSLKVVRTILPYEAQYMHDAQLLHHRAAAVRRHAQPGPLLQAGRPLRQLERAAAAGQDRRGAGGRGRGGRDGRRRHGQAGRRAVGGRRRRDRLGHHRRLRRPGVPRRPARHQDHPRASTRTWACSWAWPASSCSACTASSSGRACGWPASGRASSCCWRRRPAPPCSARWSTSTPASRCAWNMARAIALIKPCMDGGQIPVHPNAGMGVGGVPMFVHLPFDAVCRAAKSFVELLHVDGL